MASDISVERPVFDRLGAPWHKYVVADPRRRWWLAVSVICMVALLARVAIIALPSHFNLTGDPADYQIHAAFIATGHGYPPTSIASPGTPSAFRPPAYPYLLGALYAVFGVHAYLGRLLGAGMGVITVLLITLLAAALWDRRIGLVAGAIAAVSPSLVALSSSLLSEALFLPLELGISLGVLMLLRGRRLLPVAVLTGVLCAVAALTRSVGILFLLPALLAAARAPVDRMARVRASLALLASCLVALLPWTIRNADSFDAFVPLNTEAGYTLAGEYNAAASRNDDFQAIPRPPWQVPTLARSLAPLYQRSGGVNEVQLNSTLIHDAQSYIAHHPLDVPIAVGLHSLRMLNLGKNHQFTTRAAFSEMSLPQSLWNLTTISIQLITLFAALAVIARMTGRLRYRLGPLLVWAVPLVAIVASVPTVGNFRYRAPADPFLILLAAVALGRLLLPQRDRHLAAGGRT